MKIIIIITGLGMGGAERQVCDLADEFAKIDHQVLLISLTGELINLPTYPLVEITSLHMHKTSIGFIKAYAKARRIITKFKPDIVHSHMVHANLFARLLRLTTTIPRLICTAHSSNEGSKLRMLAYHLTDYLADISTNVSNEAVQEFIVQGAVKKGRMITMYNGIDTARFQFDATANKIKRAELELNESTELLLAVGRLTKAKDYPNLLHAFAQLNTDKKNVQLAIIGTGELQIELQALATTLGITERVHFLGLRHDVAQWMSAADIFVLSSKWEGLPLVMLEAMACERVVVATDCGGVKEIVGADGFLVSPKNSTKLAGAIGQAIQLSVHERTHLGSKARQRIVQNYSLSVIAQRWLQIYQSNNE